MGHKAAAGGMALQPGMHWVEGPRNPKPKPKPKPKPNPNPNPKPNHNPGGGPAELLAGMRSGLLRQAERLDAVASALQSEVAALATSLPQPYP